jgi:hypothetical protein
MGWGISFDTSILASAFEFAITLGEDCEVVAGEEKLYFFEQNFRTLFEFVWHCCQPHNLSHRFIS